MPINPNPQETEELIHSLKKYFSAELDQELSDLKARFLVDFFFKEMAPLAYNQGVKDAESFFRNKLEDLSATCFEPAFTYWQKKRK